VAFTAVEGVTGGTSRDDFLFVGSARLENNLNGGGGNNTLNYAAYSSGVYVNLLRGSATGIGGGAAGRVSNVQNVTGGMYNDILVGNARANALYGREGRDLLIGGLDADTLDGGAGEDLLIGGATDFDTQDAALQAIMSEWSRLIPYQNRANNLRAGVGLPAGVRLTEATVHDDAAVDRLTGSTGLDWFWTFGFDATDPRPDVDEVTRELREELRN
jgi:Ca2+-binding RTX toxin-like protein